MSRYGWRPYVPVAVRRTRARKKLEKLRKKGFAPQPVVIEGRKIAHTFWGRAWCDHLEKFSDYANRLPRGRTYVRNGSVVHLEIDEGMVEAMVIGQRLYKVRIEINKLPGKKWSEVKRRCAGQIGSLLELLQGRLSGSIMAVVTDRDKGLFPHPREIVLHCDCPDWAVMCKHVSAVLYGVGARLDEKPELLFLLRGLNHEELIGTETDMMTAATRGQPGSRKRIADSDLTDVFGIEMVEDEAPGADRPAHSRMSAITPGPGPGSGSGPGTTLSHSRKKKKRRAGRIAGTRSAEKRTGTRREATRRTKGSSAKKTKGQTGIKKASSTASGIHPVTGRTVARLRAKFGMSQNEFARLIGVSAPTIGNWEKRKGELNLQARTLNALISVMDLTKKDARERLEGT